RVFIDHGAGVVIGETAVVGNDVTIYQGVTLGGTGKRREKRHPTIESNVVIGANAIILGSFTIGENSRIGAGAVVTKPVPANSTVVGNPARIIVQEGKKLEILDHNNLPDVIGDLEKRIDYLERKVSGK
ncbi:MAG: serine O-acetyltransferase, partial [bacterium]